MGTTVDLKKILLSASFFLFFIFHCPLILHLTLTWYTTLPR